MNTIDPNIKESLLNSHQGAVLGAIGGFGDKLKSFFTEPAQNLSAVVSRLGVGTTAMAIVALSVLAAPGQAQAQWANASPWATTGSVSNTVNDAFQKQRQVDFANQASRVVAEQRGLTNKDQNLAGLAALGAGAFTKGDKAPIAAAIVGVGAAMLIPNSAQAQNNVLGATSGATSGGWANASPWGNNGGAQTQQANSQGQAMQQAYGSYVQYSEPQYRIALQANMEGNMQARRDAVMSFGNAWNAASQVGVPLHTVPDQVAKFQQMQRMDSAALQAGLSGVRTQAPVHQQPGMSQ